MAQNRIKPIDENKKTITSMVQERIRDAILEGVLEAGSRIDQNQLAEDLNVSLLPVREALKTLEGDGFVQIIPRRGAFVTETSVEDMEDLYFARGILEGQAGFSAAPHLSEENLTELGDLMGAISDALAAQNFHRFNDLNRRFHFIIYQAAGSQYLLNMITSLWDLAERYRYRYVFLKDRGAVIQEEHQAILDACRLRDPQRLHDAVVLHMTHTLDGIRSHAEGHD